MSPLTDSLAKCMIPVAGKSLLQWSIEAMIDAGVKRVYVGLGWQREAVRELLLPELNMQSVEYVDVPTYATGPLETLVRTASQSESERLLIAPADALLASSDVSGLVSSHRSELTIAVEPGVAGGTRVYVDDAGSVVGIGSPLTSHSFDHRSAMLLVGEPDFLGRCKTAREHGETHVVPVINRMLQQGDSVHAYPIAGKSLDIDSIDDMLIANAHLLRTSITPSKGQILVPDKDNMEIGDELVTGNGIKMMPGVRLRGPVLVSSGCHLHSGVEVGPDVSLGPNTIIGKNSRVTRAIAFGDSSIPRESVVHAEIVHQSISYKGGGANDQ